jgi:hypothetical protein
MTRRARTIKTLEPLTQARIAQLVAAGWEFMRSERENASGVECYVSHFVQRNAVKPRTEQQRKN